MISFKKSEKESPEQYIWRTCNAKDTGKIEADWSDVAAILNKEIYGMTHQAIVVNPSTGSNTRV